MKKIFLFGLLIVTSAFFSCREDIVEFNNIERDNGSIYLNSFPEGAEIFLMDSKTNLKTPEEFQELAPGDYVFTLKLSGFNDTTVVINVESGRTNSLNIRLKRKS